MKAAFIFITLGLILAACASGPYTSNRAYNGNLSRAIPSDEEIRQAQERERWAREPHPDDVQAP